jgi:hypothetical protein
MRENNFGIALYDMSIQDVKERRQKRIEYDSVKKASAKLGISENVLKRASANKDRLFLKALDGEYAIRHINTENGNTKFRTPSQKADVESPK